MANAVKSVTLEDRSPSGLRRGLTEWNNGVLQRDNDLRQFFTNRPKPVDQRPKHEELDEDWA